MDIIAWIQNNWVEIVAIYGALVTIASTIVKATPTLKDNNIVLPIIKFLSKYIALNRTENDEEIRTLRQ